MADVVSLGNSLALGVHLVDQVDLLAWLDDSVRQVRNRAVVLRLDVEQLRGGLARAFSESRVLEVNVSGQEELVTSKAPHMEVIDSSDGGQSENVAADHVSPDLFGRALHEVVDALHEGRNGSEHDKNGEEEGAERVDNLPVGLIHNDNGRNDDADRLEQVTDEMRDSSLHVNVLRLVVVVMMIMVMMVVIMSVLVAMVVTVIMMLMVVMVMRMRVAVVVVLLLLTETLEKLVSRLNFVLDLNIRVANFSLQVQVALLFDIVDVLDSDGVRVMVVVMMSMIMVLVTMTVVVASAAARAMVVTAVSTVRLEHTRHVVEDAVAVAATAAAVTDDNQVNDVAHKRDNGGDQHDLSIEVDGLVVNALVDAHDGLDHQPGDEDPNDEDGRHGAENLSTVEAERVLLIGRPPGGQD